MAAPNSSLKLLNPQKPPSSSSFSSTKLLQTSILSHINRSLSKLKSLLIQLLKNLHFIRKNKQKNLLFGSFRLYYNWCSSSSRTMPVMQQSLDYSGWSSSFQYDGMQDSGELCKYLQWLEEEADGDSSNEIDRLAELFIAECHEKFRLEKEESYRRFQEMMTGSV